MIEQLDASEQQLDTFAEDMKKLCRSKAEELHLLGYEYVTSDEVWSCVTSKYKKTGEPALHQIVNDILSLKPTRLMNYMTMEALKGSPFS